MQWVQCRPCLWSVIPLEVLRQQSVASGDFGKHGFRPFYRYSVMQWVPSVSVIPLEVIHQQSVASGNFRKHGFRPSLIITDGDNLSFTCSWSLAHISYILIISVHCEFL